MAAVDVFDPRGMLAALERNRVDYVVIGGLARVIRGTDEVPNGLDVCPGLRARNFEPMRGAVLELEATRVDRKALVIEEESIGAEPVIELRTALGELKIVPEPAGTRKGFDDLRMGATREHLGYGLRPLVALVADLARMAAALGREMDLVRARELRRVMEIEVGLQRRLGWGLER